jgi:hypothetical protein
MEAGDPFLQELEDAGLNEVKARLAAKIYSPIGPKSDIAKDWVLRKEQPLEVETRRLEDAHKVEQALTISRTAEAAERQALAAEKATRVAVAALVVAVGRNSKRHRYGSTLRGA